MKSGQRALSRCWWLALLSVLSFVFVAASECEQTSDGGRGGGSGKPDLTGIVSAVPGATAEAEGVRITLNEIIDPWLSDTFMQPDPGRRFVAFDVTIQNVDGGTQSASAFKFELSDAEDFVYNATFGPDPILDSIDLGSRQKTRGWIAFEVNEGTPLKLLKYDPDVFTTSDIEFQFPVSSGEPVPSFPASTPAPSCRYERSPLPGAPYCGALAGEFYLGDSPKFSTDPTEPCACPVGYAWSTSRDSFHGQQVYSCDVTPTDDCVEVPPGTLNCSLPTHVLAGRCVALGN